MDTETPRPVAEDADEVLVVARGIATAVAPETGITNAQADLLEAIATALTGVSVDYRTLEALGPDELAAALAAHDDEYRHRIVHHMVLGELVLRPLPTVVSFRVSKYAEALGVKDDFVRVARRYAQGAYGLAWMDLQRSGFADHLKEAGEPTDTRGGPGPFESSGEDDELAETWASFESLPAGSLGRTVWEMYDGRGFSLPGTRGGAPKYLAQHDFVHVLGDYGTNLKGELEVFALIARADPDPKGFAWLATLFGLFETGYIADTGFFTRDTDGGHHAESPGMSCRIADAVRRGKALCIRSNTDLFEVDYYANAARPVGEVREMLGVPEKSASALEEGSVGLFDENGMSDAQRRAAARRKEAAS